MSKENYGSMYHNEDLLEDLRLIKEDMRKAQLQKQGGKFNNMTDNYFKRLEASLLAKYSPSRDFPCSDAGGDFGDCDCGCDCGGDCDCD